MTRLLCCFVIAGLMAGALAACAPDTLPPPEGSAAAASPTTGGPINGKPQPNSEMSKNQSANQAVTGYDCGNGQTVTVRYPSASHAKITYKGQTRSMHIAVSASGARYVGQDYEWWTHDTGPSAEATLFKHQKNGATGDKIATCQPR